MADSTTIKMVVSLLNLVTSNNDNLLFELAKKIVRTASSQIMGYIFKDFLLAFICFFCFILNAKSMFL